MEKMDLVELLSGTDAGARIAKLEFEDGLKLLEELVGKVESGTLPLEKAINSYEKGMTLIGHLRQLLSGAEEKLQILSKPASAKS
jgi:exodeoxyribonuclease VII small subunit